MRIGQGAALQRLHSTLDSTRLLLIRVSRSLASSRLLPVLGLFTSLLALAFAFLWRFSHLLTAVVLFRYIWKSLYAFYQAKLGGAWGPAFPPHRTNFILAVGTIPIWGLGMAGIMLASAIVRRLWSGARLRWEGGKRGGHVNGNGHGRYEAIPLNVDDVEEMEEEDTRRRRQRRESPTPALKTRLLWLGLLVFYLSLALFGLYMWKTYELPIDNRFKARVELANRVPKREGYSTQEKIYIAAMFYNNEGVLPYWITQTTRLIHYLGPDNVFVSIVESNSGDKTAALLESFADTLTSLAVSHKITTHDTTIPRPPSMDTAPPRIEFLIFVNPLVINSYSWEFYVYFKYITRHWVVKWFIEHVENGYGFHQARMILGNPENVYMWDGGACHPWR
ncbi:hypothetical protein MIND_01189600 [Mycena indigotica]|uniref:Glycosyltransferase family 69 protein n=1 Tax=Mycena indigotica TaxID=2126181 RepID=A0A8H6S633_9AGAR|nr:uncharacterized protein MIND_01189600 [Mycena indigotica]KAF7292905.1 hypothetical protein MIND_01189600 [Mycena indigotica]